MNNLFEQHKYSPKNKSVLKMVNDFEQKHKAVFSKVKSQWLPAIREFLREETGLKMHQKVIGTKIHKDSNISFQFVTDRNETFIKLIDEHYPDLDFDEYTAFYRLHVRLRSSSKFFNNKPEEILVPFNKISNFLDDYLKKYNLKILMDNLFKKSGESADIWGTYFFEDNRIEVYYVPLILFSQINNLPLEHAILSTLVHEMAHAYHHKGKDKDNVIWQKMNSADLKITEGMAEYFTWLFVEEYKNNHRGMEETYRSMFNCLGEEYTIFEKWTPTYSKEAIKSALLSVRKRSITKYEDFQTLLENVKKVLH
jgi:hypothetical protein